MVHNHRDVGLAVAIEVAGIEFNRLATLSYPSGLVVQYVYTSLGYLAQLKDNASGAVLWTADSRDAEMHLTDQVAGNGVDTIQVFDPNTGLVQQIRASGDGSDDGSTANLSYQFDRIGNLKNRSDNYGATEQFCYDALNRLTNYSVNGATCRAGGLLKSVAYDDTGNIVSKSDLTDTSGGTGAYTYANPGNPLPHAVKSINGTVNGVADPGFRYDANGNLTCEYTGPNCSHGAITKETDAYWSFNMAHTVTDGSTSLTLTYDSEHARVTQALTTASTTTTTTYLNDPINGAMSEKVATGGTNTWNDYLMVDGKLIGERTCTAPTPTCASGATLQYFVLDHLGSVAVVTGGNGAVLTGNGRLSFDAWGKQRNEDGTDDQTCSNGLTAPTTKGFTSQEEIAALCLVNLNARIYDPTIGRFMAADTTIPDPYDLQSYNRYTYTDNRPLSFTDTTGHDPSCIGSCLSPSSYPNMSCWGSCGGSSIAITMTMTAPDGFVLGTLTISANTDGASAMNTTCSEGCGALDDMVSKGLGPISTVADAGRALATIAAQNTQGSGGVYGASIGAPHDIQGSSPGTSARAQTYGPTNSGLIAVQSTSPPQDPSGLEYWEPGARWNDIPDWEGTETLARSEVLHSYATYGELMDALFRQSRVHGAFEKLVDQKMPYSLIGTVALVGGGASYKFKNDWVFSDRNGDAMMDQILI
jgi:RHS repeat-associated protein